MLPQVTSDAFKEYVMATDVPDTLSPRLLTMAEAAEQLHISYRELHRLIKRGDLPVIRISDRLVRIAPSDLTNLIKRNRKELE
jgi:excisionase family DNA binding protein